MDQRQPRRCRSGSRGAGRLDRRQPTPVQFRLHSIAGERRRGRDTQVRDGRRLGTETRASRAPLPPVPPRLRRHLLGRSPLPQRRSHVRRLSPAPQPRVLLRRSPAARLPEGRHFGSHHPAKLCAAVPPPEISKLQKRSAPEAPLHTPDVAPPRGHASHVYIATRRPRARAQAAAAAAPGFPRNPAL